MLEWNRTEALFPKADCAAYDELVPELATVAIKERGRQIHLVDAKIDNALKALASFS